MGDFSYEVPNTDDFMQALLALLEVRGEKSLAHLLRGANCSISTSSTYSQVRWNAYSTSVYFYIPVTKLVKLTPEAETKLISYCDQIMPVEAGFDVLAVALSPLLGSQNKATTQEEIEQISTSLRNSSSIELPPDLLQKGQEMAEIYLYLYCAENVLRVFIASIASSNLGHEYVGHLTISRSMKDAIALRKTNESKNKWLSVRGESELFYLDFSDLGELIINNWTLFKDFFPNQAWIKTKVEEMAHCRNLIAHNSYVSPHERDVIRLNFTGIMRQIENKLAR
jgi:hypothetical protein